jgi:hypothetical protein
VRSVRVPGTDELAQLCVSRTYRCSFGPRSTSKSPGPPRSGQRRTITAYGCSTKMKIATYLLQPREDDASGVYRTHYVVTLDTAHDHKSVGVGISDGGGAEEPSGPQTRGMAAAAGAPAPRHSDDLATKAKVKSLSAPMSAVNKFTEAVRGSLLEVMVPYLLCDQQHHMSHCRVLAVADQHWHRHESFAEASLPINEAEGCQVLPEPG